MDFGKRYSLSVLFTCRYDARIVCQANHRGPEYCKMNILTVIYMIYPSLRGISLILVLIWKAYYANGDFQAPPPR